MKTESIEDLLIAQVISLIRTTAEHAADKDHDASIRFETHFYRLIGAECTAKADAFSELGANSEEH
jgi:hypothetical protein